MSHMLKLFRDKPERLGDTDVVYIYQRLNVVLSNNENMTYSSIFDIITTL